MNGDYLLHLINVLSCYVDSLLLYSIRTPLKTLLRSDYFP